MKLLIKNGFIVNADENLCGIHDILIENGIISKVGNSLEEEDSQILDAEGLHIFPGFVDVHCHLRDPGFEYKEDIESGTRSAAMGGFTSIACMPNTKPVIDNKVVISYLLNKIKKDAVVNVFPIGAVTKGQKGEELAEIGEMKFAGAVAISDDGNPIDNPAIMKKALAYASMFDIVLISHCEDKRLVEGGVINEGYMSTKLGLRGIPTVAEDIMVARDIILSEYTGVPIHIAHVSTAGSVEIIRNAKKRGVKVTAETCPHYFSLTEEACEGYNTNAKMNPPLRTRQHLEAIKEALKDGTIDIIATDHAPHHEDDKNVEFETALNGIVGFETAVPLTITYLVKSEIITLSQMANIMCRKPAELLRLNKGVIAEGRSADIAIVDINEKYTVNVNEFASKSKNSPYNGYELTGRVKYTIVGGKIVVSESKLV